MARAVEKGNQAPESLDPTGLWRLGFWLIWILGHLTLLFALALGMVPRLRNDPFTVDYAIRLGLAALTLVSILMARWIWKIRNPIAGQEPPLAMRVVVMVSWVELIFALVSILAIAESHLFAR